MYEQEIVKNQAKSGGSAEAIFSISMRKLGVIIGVCVLIAACYLSCSNGTTPINSNDNAAISMSQTTPTVFKIGQRWYHEKEDATIVLIDSPSQDTWGIGIQINGSQQIRATITDDNLKILSSDPDWSVNSNRVKLGDVDLHK